MAEPTTLLLPLGKSKFSRLSAKIGKKGKVKNPDAVAAAIGRAKYGKKKFAAKGAAGRRKARKALTDRGPIEVWTPEGLLKAANQLKAEDDKAAAKKDLLEQHAATQQPSDPDETLEDEAHDDLMDIHGQANDFYDDMDQEGQDNMDEIDEADTKGKLTGKHHAQLKDAIDSIDTGGEGAGEGSL